MNVLNKVTLQSLKKNRIRTVVTIIGIILSAAMICAVTTFASSIYNYALENAVYVDGDWHGCAEDVDLKTFNLIKNDNKVSDFTYAKQLGYSYLDGCSNENKPYLFVLATSKGFSDMLPVRISSGRYPVLENEILIPKHLLENGGLQYNIGDKIELNLGKRMLNGFSVGQNTPFYIYDKDNKAVPNGEDFEVTEKRVYTVVGFYERPSFEKYTAPGYTAITVADTYNDNEYKYNVWYKMNKIKDVYSFIEENELPMQTNSAVLKYSGISRYEGFNSMIISLSVIVILLIMFGSISLIYNAFSISVAERTKQFGLLSSIGATKKQLRKMVISEALMVSAVGIPIGIIAGIGGIGITLLFMGNKFKALIGYTIPLKLKVSVLSIVIAVAVALITVMVSAIIPSKRATRVSAIEAIRQSKDISVKYNKINTFKIVYKVFGLPGMLANKYYKRSRKKYRATVVSLFMSVVLFVSASAFTGELTKSVGDSFGNIQYDILVYGHENEFKTSSAIELLTNIKNDSGVKQAACSKSDSFFSMIDAKCVTERYLEYYAKSENLSVQQLEKASVFTTFKFVDDATFKELLEEYKLEEEKYYNKEKPLAIALDGRVLFDSELGKYTSYNVLAKQNTELTIGFVKGIDGYSYLGDEIDGNGNKIYTYRNEENNEDKMFLTHEEAFKEIKANIGKVIYDPPYYIEVNSRLALIYPLSMRDYVLTEDNPNNPGYSYFVTTDNHTETEKAIEETLSELRLPTLRIQNIAADEEENRNTVTIIRVFSYGFIVLISLIAAANVFNTISTNIALRKREFAMLKSVGMTSKGFNKMMNFECVLYGTKSLLFGLPVAVGISYLIYLAVNEGYEKNFVIPLEAILIAVLSVFLIVFITMMYSMNKVKKENPIDVLKNENY